MSFLVDDFAFAEASELERAATERLQECPAPGACRGVVSACRELEGVTAAIRDLGMLNARLLSFAAEAGATSRAAASAILANRELNVELQAELVVELTRLHDTAQLLLMPEPEGGAS